jgi:hypothetical protein
MHADRRSRTVQSDGASYEQESLKVVDVQTCGDLQVERWGRNSGYDFSMRLIHAGQQLVNIGRGAGPSVFESPPAHFCTQNARTTAKEGHHRTDGQVGFHGNRTHCFRCLQSTARHPP